MSQSMKERRTVILYEPEVGSNVIYDRSEWRLMLADLKALKILALHSDSVKIRVNDTFGHLISRLDSLQLHYANYEEVDEELQVYFR